MITLSAIADEISPDLEVQMDVLASEGIHYIDLRSVGGKHVLQLSDEEIAMIKKRIDVRGFKISSIASPIGKISITASFTPLIKDLMRAIQIAKFFGTPYIRIFAFIIPPEEMPNKYRAEVLRRMKMVTDIAENEGIILLVENDTTMYVDNGERARDILESINSPCLRFAFDPANFIQSEVLPMTDAYALVEPYISYIHMKDARIDTKEVVPPGDGDGEIRELLLALKEKEFSGFISIEPKGRPGLADPNFFLIAVRALKKLLKNIGMDWNNHSNGHRAGEIPTSSIHINGASSKIHSSETVPSWIPLTSLEKMEQTDYDVIVIGSGAGGGAALWRLCDKWRNSGKKVGMIEAGDLLLPTNLVNLSLFTGKRGEQYTSQIITPIGLTLPEFPGAKQIFALGGRTLQWTAASPRMPLYTLLNWPVTKKEMNHYYNIAEQVMNVNKSFAKSSSLILLFLNQLWTNGFLKASEVPMAVDIKPTKYGEIHSNAIFSSILFLAEALNNKAFDLAVKARAVQLLIENGKTVGVKVMSPDMRSYFIKTKTIVLSASTLETPRLLLYSGIAGSAIGHYLLDHSALRVIGEMDRNRLQDDLEPVRILIPNTKENPYQIQMTIQEQVLKEEVEIFIHSYGSVEPRYENKVFLDPKRRDEYGVPKIQVNYNYSNRDLAVIQQMAAGTRRAMESFGVLKGEPYFYLRPPGDDNHESGTCRMGIDPSTSAVNQYGQIHGISGLYVADNSVLPSLGANPTLTTVALAIRTADYIIQQFR